MQTAVVCHVSRSSCLAKTILQGTVQGGRREGRQRNRWEDNIREWTGLEFAKSQRAVENREKRRKLAVKSSVVPKHTDRQTKLPLYIKGRMYKQRISSLITLALT